MAANPCAQCGAHKAHPVHSKMHPQYHPHESSRTAWGDKPKSAVNARSAKTEAYYADVRRDAVGDAQGKPCEAVVDGVCVGYRTVARDIHEIVSRSQAGSLEAAVALGTMIVCRACHDWITEHPVEAGRLGLRRRRPNKQKE